MTSDILTAAGIPFRRSRFPQPAEGTFAHSVTVELYEPAPDDAAEAALEAQLNARGIPWDKQDRYWLQAEQRYQVVYDFDYVEKRRI